MTAQRITWTALPTGFNPGGSALTLSVFVSPQLSDPSPSPTLSLFPDWLDWPSTIMGATWSVVVAGTPHPGTVVSAAPVSARWTDLFGPATNVTSYSFDAITGKNIRSYPAFKILQFIEQVYTQLAINNGGSYPPVQLLLGAGEDGRGILTPIAFRQDPRRPGSGPYEPNVAASLETQLAASRASDPLNHNAAMPTPLITDTDYSLYFEQQKNYYDRGTPAALPPPAPPVPTFDFHQAVSSLSNHPPLMRILGLVVDLTIPVVALPPGGAVWVQPTWSPALAATTNIIPHTLYDSSFLPAPNPPASPDVQNGILPLDTGDFTMVPVDIDGGGTKLVEFATAIARVTATLNGSGTTSSPDSYTVPSLRSGGVALARNGQAPRLVQNFDVSTSLANTTSTSPPGSPTLGSDDVTRGYRIDVWDTSKGHWRQLCARVAGPYGAGGPLGYTFLASNTVVPVPAGDEGWVSLALTGDPNGDPDDQYAGESLLRWGGWSLVAQRPGAGLGKTPADGVQPVGPTTPGNDVPMQVTYAASPGTLPVLRFGHTYRLRARAVDLAGNSLPFDPAAPGPPFPGMSPPVYYARAEPVAAPSVLLKSPTTEGEHLERLVIRSTRWNTPNSKVTQTTRHVVAPRSVELMAEQHGLLDTLAGDPDPAQYNMLVARNDADLPGAVIDPDNYSLPYYPVTSLSVPYLPDPMARLATLSGVPGTGGPIQIQLQMFPTPWPNTESFRILMVGGPTGTPPVLPTPSNRVLKVTVPKGETAQVNLSSSFFATDLYLFQLWNWITEALPPGPALTALSNQIAQGGHWMFTPWRTITLVHAVRQPLVAPSFEPGFVAMRTAEGQTDAVLTGVVDIDLKSTLRLEIHAQWNEFVDADPTPDVPTVARAVPVILTLDPDDPDGDNTGLGQGIRPDTRHQFGDTKHRIVDYSIIASTRFAEYFIERATPTLNGTTATKVDSAGIVIGQETVTSADNSVTYRRDEDYTINATKGRIARVATGAIPDGATVNVAYVNPPITRSSLESIASPPTPLGDPVNVLSTKRPAAPDVRYVIPTFEWTTPSIGPGTQASERLGRSLRVYLGRPWWTSGENEQLGVVLWPNPSVPQTSDAQTFVTMWGNDPVWVSPGLAYTPTISDLTLAVSSSPSVYLREYGGDVAVAGHAVEFDQARQLWYCDIQFDQLDTFSYWPFVRLALARYQPDSLDFPYSDGGLFLSPVVLADFAQLAPDRGAVLTFDTVDPTHVHLSVVGDLPFDLGGGISPNTATATIQTQIPGVSDPDLMWQDVSTLALTFYNHLVTSFIGDLYLPAPRGSQPFRILIQEFENLPLDGGGGLGQRLVYADALQI